MEYLVYILLIVTSIVGLTFIVERGLALRWKKVVPQKIEDAIEAHDLPILRVHLGADPDAGLAALERAVVAALDIPTEA